MTREDLVIFETSLKCDGMKPKTDLRTKKMSNILYFMFDSYEIAWRVTSGSCFFLSWYYTIVRLYSEKGSCREGLEGLLGGQKRRPGRSSHLFFENFPAQDIKDFAIEGFNNLIRRKNGVNLDIDAKA